MQARDFRVERKEEKNHKLLMKGKGKGNRKVRINDKQKKLEGE